MFDKKLNSCKWNGQKQFLIAFIREEEVTNNLNVCDTGRKIQNRFVFTNKKSRCVEQKIRVQDILSQIQDGEHKHFISMHRLQEW